MTSSVATHSAPLSPEAKFNLMNAIFGSGARPVDFIDRGKVFRVIPGSVRTQKKTRAAVRATLDPNHWRNMSSRLLEISGDTEIAESVLLGRAKIVMQEE